MQKEWGQYELLTELGRGYTGSVWKAQHRETGEIVAIKILLEPMGLPDAGRRERFQREARSLSAITHPAVPRVFEVGVWDGYPYMVREFFPGRSLREELDRRKKFPADSARRIVLELLAALEAIHAQEIVHRDLKPENIILQVDGAVRLLDFGCAYDDLEESLTRTGEIIGSPAYMSPEQIRGKAVDARSDLFAVGILLHELLTGQRPFAGAHPLDLLRAIESAPPSLSPQVSALERTVIQKALAKSPADRFASALEMREVLEGKRSVPVATTLPSRRGDVSFAPNRGSGKHWFGRIVGGMVALLALGILGALAFVGYNLLQTSMNLAKDTAARAQNLRSAADNVIAQKSPSGTPPKGRSAGSAVPASGTAGRQNIPSRAASTTSRQVGKTDRAPSSSSHTHRETSGTHGQSLPTKFYYATSDQAEAAMARNCSTCGGSRTVEHPECRGTGKCAECDGERHLKDKCPGCQGVGKARCNFCSGSGFQEAMQRPCPQCGGSGKSSCVFCDGSGHRKCPKCSGTGKCSRCSGRGRFACPTCK
ncbi:MAG: hypothetical protein OHK0029_05710 [Armatimonadaceae bacterium]